MSLSRAQLLKVTGDETARNSRWLGAIGAAFPGFARPFHSHNDGADRLLLLIAWIARATFPLLALLPLALFPTFYTGAGRYRPSGLGAVETRHGSLLQ
jgi:hypothetical protein